MILDRRVAPAEPWDAKDRVNLAVAMGGALIGLTVAWLGVSGTASEGRAILYVEVGVAALAVNGVAACLWLMAGRRAIGERQRVLVGLLGQAHHWGGADDGSSAVWDRNVTSARMTRFHAPDCPIVEGKAVEEYDPLTTGVREACQICASSEASL